MQQRDAKHPVWLYVFANLQTQENMIWIPRSETYFIGPLATILPQALRSLCPASNTVRLIDRRPARQAS